MHDLLGAVAVVEHLDQAEALWRRNGVVATYVTPAGEVLSPTGRLRGGSEGTTLPQSLLTRKRQLRELEDDVRRLGDENAQLRREAAILKCCRLVERPDLPGSQGRPQTLPVPVAGRAPLDAVRQLC